MTDLLKKNIEEHQEIIKSLFILEPNVSQATVVISESLKYGGKLMLCGNGGSAADCQHIASEFTGRFIFDRRPLAAIALTTDTSALTSISNDYSSNKIFSRQIEAIGRESDVLLAISTSGNSKNVIEAINIAKKKGIKVVGLLGRDGGIIGDLCDVSIVVKSQSTARIQEAHILIGHTLCGGVENNLIENR